ncbi:HAD family hydrolase [Chloroflexota bacterium]
MNKLKVVSVDLFRTLVELESIEQVIWREVLGNQYTADLAKECLSHIGNSLFDYLPSDKFLSLKSIFTLCFSEVFSRFNLDIDPSEAANTWAQHHPHSKPYTDSIPFLNSVGKRYLICLASDADDEMLGGLKQIYTFDDIFTSERLCVYKSNGDGRFFNSIIDHYKVKPEEIIHIGDGRREIIGANKVGIITCWLNRVDMKWLHEIKPDYEVKSLIEAASVLGVNIDSH